MPLNINQINLKEDTYTLWLASQSKKWGYSIDMNHCYEKVLGFCVRTSNNDSLVQVQVKHWTL